jgi:hypothetical protein
MTNSVPPPTQRYHDFSERVDQFVSYTDFYAKFGFDILTRPEFMRQVCYLVRNMVFDVVYFYGEIAMDDPNVERMLVLTELADVLLTDSEDDERQSS